MKPVYIHDLKNEFHEWCALLSEEEIISNPNLVRVIERIEKLFQIMLNQWSKK